MPPNLTNLRSLLSPSPLFLSHPILFFSPKPFSYPLRRFPLLTALASRSNRQHSRPFTSARRNSCSSMERREREAAEMEEEGLGFNKRRAEGRDKSDGVRKVLKLKQRKLNPNTICYLQIMGTGMDTQDTSPAVLLFFDQQRFIFNAGEGLQRFCTEHKIKLSKIDHIFLSRVCSETAGGLPGLLLTLAGMGDEGMSVNVWGPSDIKYLIDAMQSFIPKAAMVHTHSFGSSPSPDGLSLSNPANISEPIVLIDDELVKISAILLQPNAKKTKNPSMMETDVGDKRNQNLETFSQKSQVGLKPGDISVVYVCELPEIKGTFHPKKAVALGLRPGPKYRELQLGNSVKSDRQDITVHPSDVMDPSIPGPIVLIVDCPTMFHLQELSSLKSFSNYYEHTPSTPSEETSKNVTCIIHLSPSSVINTPDYRKWMERFSGARHIMAGHEMKNVEIPVLKASARIAARLNYLCPQFFPASGFWSLPHLNGTAPGFQTLSETASKHCESISAENLLKFQLRPYAQLGIDRSGVPILNSKSEIIDNLLSEIPEIVDAAKQVNQFWTEGKCVIEDTVSSLNKDIMFEEPWLNENILPSCLKEVSREDMEIVLLGTGSSQPSKYRNVSSIFINLFSKGSLLLDCGEGTLGQLKRRFGVEGADDAVRGLRCIWISHIHADHHTGLARILALRRNLLKEEPHEPLLVIGPRQLKRYLDAYQLLEDLDMEFLDCKNTTVSALKTFESSNGQSTECPSNYNTNQEIDSTLFAKGGRMQSYWNSPANNSVVEPLIKKMKNVLNDAGLEGLVSFPVVHCPNAFGLMIKAANRINNVGENIEGWKVVYSGDSRPCPEIIKAAQGATVLIHEATFEDGLVEEAIARNHSTTKEAIDAGNSAGVYRIILTHFSQRYPKIPVFDETHMHNTCIAFDLMSVNLADLPVLPKVLPYLRILFKNEMIVDESDDVLTEASEIS